MIKTCIKCKTKKDSSQFRNIHNKTRGKFYLCSYCVECEKEVKKIRNHFYYKNNKNEMRIAQKNYIRQRRDKDITFRLGSIISRHINRPMILFGGSKSGKSTFKFLPYSKLELKQHLEKQFEPWMNWNNYGIYSGQTWDDNDSSTWMWNIDHIIPKSCLPFISMEDGNFKKCWALNNLRPLSAKQNFLEGVNRTRHGDI